MKFSKSKIAVAFGAVLGFGMVGQASADVYGLSHLLISGLTVTAGGTLTGGGAGIFTFSGNQDAILNNVDDPTSGFANCAGIFAVTNNCAAVSPWLSGEVQNAPPTALPGAPIRGNGDYTEFGMDGDYSNAEAEVISAVLLLDGSTTVESISESNLGTIADGSTAFGAQANTNIGSNTFLTLGFVGAGGTLTIDFDATIDLATEVTDGDTGLALASSSATFQLQKDGVTIATWAPNGTSGVITTCSVVCSSTEAAFTLNSTATSFGVANGVSGGGSYTLDVSGLSSGEYSIAFSTTTTTDLFRVVPVPSTLLLMGTGLLLGARATRRKKNS